MSETPTPPASTHAVDIPVVSWREAFWTWCRVAALSFGGPAGQIAVMHRIIVDEKKWISEERFLHALNYCMLLPGPEAQQLATYIGWLLHRTPGGLLAGTLFILPGFISILLLSIIYTKFGNTAIIAGIFFGLKPAVMAIVVEAVQRIGKRVLKNRTMLTIAVLAFLAIFLCGVPFPALIAVAAVVGFIGGKLAPEQFYVIKGHGSSAATSTATTPAPQPAFSSLLMRSVLVSVVCLTLWFGPLLAVYVMLGPDSVYTQEGIFFSKAAVVTFGGAYSVLAYIAQQAVDKYHWLAPGEMLDGLGLAETTPGPLIMVVQFVGYLGAYRQPGALSPLWAGVWGSILTTWVTFVPCFYWIFLGAPFIERLRGNRLLSSALSSITAAVVGVVLNLAVWFALHTLFREVHSIPWHGLSLELPRWSSLDLRTTAIAGLAFVLMFYLKWGAARTLAASALTGAMCVSLV